MREQRLRTRKLIELENEEQVQRRQCSEHQPNYSKFRRHVGAEQEQQRVSDIARNLERKGMDATLIEWRGGTVIEAGMDRSSLKSRKASGSATPPSMGGSTAPRTLQLLVPKQLILHGA